MMSGEKKEAGTHNSPDSPEITSNRTSTSDRENRRYIYEDITIGSNCSQAAVSKTDPMTLRGFKMDDRSISILGAVSEETVKKMLKEATAVQKMATELALQQQHTSEEKSGTENNMANTTAGASSSFSAPGRVIGAG